MDHPTWCGIGMDHPTWCGMGMDHPTWCGMGMDHPTWSGFLDLCRDIDKIEDPLKKQSTIAFIHNFGQMPKQVYMYMCTYLNAS